MSGLLKWLGTFVAAGIIGATVALIVAGISMLLGAVESSSKAVLFVEYGAGAIVATILILLTIQGLRKLHRRIWGGARR